MENVMGIEWQEGAVCFADGEQWFVNAGAESEKYQLANLKGDRGYSFYGISGFSKDFQLNTIKQGDFIEASELDTEQEYNDVVEVFGLFGFDVSGDFEWFKDESCRYDLFFIDEYKDLDSCVKTYRKLKRKLTYPQIMAIGELKRLEIEKSTPKTTSDLTPDIGAKTSKDYLNECIEVQNQRGEQYDSKGTGERSFAAAASAFNAMTGQNLKGSDVCLLLACVKAVRQYSDTTRVHEDSLLDLVSYASLWAEELNKEAK